MHIPNWKILDDWTQAQILEQLSISQALPLNHPFDEPEQADPKFYLRVCSEAVVGAEAIGAPLVDGAFTKAWEFAKNYRFSDPIQVEAFFSDQTQLRDRCMVLEIKALGLNFLGSVRITEVHESTTAECTRRGYRYDTLNGHPENGSEWFILEKNHSSGEIKFRIASAVRSGTFPNWWTRIGYRLVGKIYRDRWHTQSYRRMQKHIGNRIDSEVHISNDNCRIGFDAGPGIGKNRPLWS